NSAVTSDCRNQAKHDLFAAITFDLLGEVSIERAAGSRNRHWLEIDVAQLEAKAERSREDQCFPCDVESREIIARIGFRIPAPLRLIYGFGERTSLFECSG